MSQGPGTFAARKLGHIINILHAGLQFFLLGTRKKQLKLSKYIELPYLCFTGFKYLAMTTDT
jgi:hypothetical protein